MVRKQKGKVKKVAKKRTKLSRGRPGRKKNIMKKYVKKLAKKSKSKRKRR